MAGAGTTPSCLSSCSWCVPPACARPSDPTPHSPYPALTLWRASWVSSGRCASRCPVRGVTNGAVAKGCGQAHSHLLCAHPHAQGGSQQQQQAAFLFATPAHTNPATPPILSISGMDEEVKPRPTPPPYDSDARGSNLRDTARARVPQHVSHTNSCMKGCKNWERGARACFTRPPSTCLR